MAEAKIIKVRVLAKCEHGEPDDVVELTAAEVKALAGIVDADPAAVTYAESLK
jgi:hypothetical protein